MVKIVFKGGWQVFQWSSYTACIRVLGEERNTHPISPFSFEFIVKYVRRIEPRSFNGRKESEWSSCMACIHQRVNQIRLHILFLMEDEYSNGQVIWLVSEYSEKKEAYAQLILFHSIFYCKRGLVWIGSRFRKDDKHSNDQAICLVSKYSGKKEAYTQLFLLHSWRRQVIFGLIIKSWADVE